MVPGMATAMDRLGLCPGWGAGTAAGGWLQLPTPAKRLSQSKGRLNKPRSVETSIAAGTTGRAVHEQSCWASVRRRWWQRVQKPHHTSAPSTAITHPSSSERHAPRLTLGPATVPQPLPPHLGSQGWGCCDTVLRWSDVCISAVLLYFSTGQGHRVIPRGGEGKDLNWALASAARPG